MNGRLNLGKFRFYINLLHFISINPHFTKKNNEPKINDTRNFLNNIKTAIAI